MLEHRYHLDEPFLVRYWEWLKAALHGDLGVSIPLRQEVADIIAQRVAVTPRPGAVRVGADPRVRDRLGRAGGAAARG